MKGNNFFQIFMSIIMTLVLVLIAVVGVRGYRFLEDYREYCQDYDEFQEFKVYKYLVENGEIGDYRDEVVSSNKPEVVVPTEPEEVVLPAEPTPEPEPTPESTPEIVNDREYIAALVAEREEVYTWPDNYEKTLRINEIDKKILASAGYDFSEMNANFLGDSITEGIGGREDEDGKKISYVEYVDQYLHFQNVLKYGMAGRTLTDHNRPEISIAGNEENLINMNSKVTVIYAGINDYLIQEDVKRYGVLDSISTAGYCGQLRSFSDYLHRYCGDLDIFFVTSYRITQTDDCFYQDFDGQPTLDDYMNPQRILAARNGYHVIELYNTGFMSMEDPITVTRLFADSVHPNDEGYRILGEHIAAEILLYYLGFWI